MLSFFFLFLLFHPLPPSVIVFLAFSFSTYFLSMLFFLFLLFSLLSLCVIFSLYLLFSPLSLNVISLTLSLPISSVHCFFSLSLNVVFSLLLSSCYFTLCLPTHFLRPLLLFSCFSFPQFLWTLGFFFTFSLLFSTLSLNVIFSPLIPFIVFFLFLLYQLTLSVGFSPPPTTIRWSFSSSSFSFYIPPSLSVSLPPPLTLFPFSFSLQRKLITRNITLRRIMRPSTAVDITKWSLIQWYNFIPRRQSRNKELALYIMRLSLVMQLHVCVYLSIYHWNIISGK